MARASQTDFALARHQGINYRRRPSYGDRGAVSIWSNAQFHAAAERDDDRCGRCGCHMYSGRGRESEVTLLDDIAMRGAWRIA